MLCFDPLMECDDEDHLRDEAGRFALQLGFEFWAFSARVPTGGQETPAWSIGNLPKDLEAARRDCFARHAGMPLSPLARHGIPREWSVHDPALAGLLAEPALQGFGTHALRHGLQGGMLVPVPVAQGFALLVLATCHHVSSAALQQARPAALLFSRYLHLACMPHIERFARERRPKLRAREIECLSWAAQGKTTWEISRLLEISKHTVDFHLRNACERLDAVSRQRAVAKATELGLLSLP